MTIRNRAFVYIWLFPGLQASAATAAGQQTSAAGPVVEPVPAVGHVVQPPAGLDLYRPAAAGLPASAAAAELGRRLFFERRLSLDGSLTCGTCHRPNLAFTDGRRVPEGIGGRAGTRNVPTLVNRAYGLSQFRDGRAASLLEQVLEPVANPREMALPVDSAVARLAADPSYERAFREAMGGAVTADALAAALAAFVGSVYSGDAPVDRYMAGDTLALSAEARHGRRLFRGRAGCAACHIGPNHTDERFRNTGVAWFADGPPADSGRFHVTRDTADIGAFRTPTLREVARTAPYMHDGSLATLEDVIAFYDAGGRANPNLDPAIRPLGLTEAERRALLAYLHALSGTVRYP
jgi:cytochrome c peroxidase